MRRVRNFLAVGAILVATLLPATPARAGGWAVTALDPLPQRLEAGRTYTVGYWVLQHGSHPYEGDLGQTGLKLVDDRGRMAAFQGVALPEPAHFAAAIAVPQAGSWKLYSQQGVFADYRVGTLTVPGGLVVSRPPTPMAMHRDTHWGAIRPPDLAAMAKDTALPVNAGAVGAAAPPAPELATQPAAPARRGNRVLPGGVVVAVIVAAAGIGGALLAGRQWMLRDAAAVRPRRG